MKILKFFLTFVVLVLLGSVLYLGYLGFVPVLSTVMGADKPKDLGVRSSEQDYTRSIEKVGGSINSFSTTSGDVRSSISYSGKVDVNTDFSQEELSSRLNYAQWKYLPFTDSQVRINSDGTAEYSGVLRMDRLPEFVAYVGMGRYSMADITKGIKYINLVKVNPPVYLKLKAGVSGNILNTRVLDAQVGRFSLPLGTLHADETASAVFSSIVSRIPGFYAKSVELSKGAMHFEGTLPKTVNVETGQ